MGTTNIIAIIGAMGGVQGLVELARWWFGRKTEQRQTEVNVEAVEDENDRRQVDWLEKRMQERDTKIDALYAELRAVQAQYLNEVHAHHETQLALKEAEYKKCNKRGCGDRLPPSDY